MVWEAEGDYQGLSLATSARSPEGALRPGGQTQEASPPLLAVFLPPSPPPHLAAVSVPGPTHPHIPFPALGLVN